MASSKSIESGGAFVRIFADNGPLKRGLKQAQSMLSGWAGSLKSIGTKIAAPLALAGVTGLGALMAMSDQFVAMGASQAGTAGQAAVLGASLARLRNAVRILSINLFATFAPALSLLYDWLTRVAVGASQWISQNRQLILTAVAVAAALGAGGVAIAALGTGLSMAATAISGFLTLLGFVGSILAFVISPVGLLISGIATLTTWFLTSTETGRGALAWLAAAFGDLATDATTAWGGIVAAIGAGDLQGAFNIAMAYLRVIWTQLTGYLEEKWLEFRDGFMNVVDEIVGFFQKIFVDAGPALEMAWVNTLNFLLNAWTKFTSMFMRGWRTAQNFVGKGFAWIIAKMNGQDPAEVMAEMDADLDRRNKAAAAAAAGTIQMRNQSRDERLAQINANMDPESRAAFEAIDNRTRSRRQERQAARQSSAAAADANLVAARENLAKAVKSVATKTATPDLGPGAQRSMQAASATDIRSAEGLKSVMFALTGQSNPQLQLVGVAKQQLDTQKRQLEEAEKTRKAVEAPPEDGERLS